MPPSCQQTIPMKVMFTICNILSVPRKFLNTITCHTKVHFPKRKSEVGKTGVWTPLSGRGRVSPGSVSSTSIGPLSSLGSRGSALVCRLPSLRQRKKGLVFSMLDGTCSSRMSCYECGATSFLVCCAVRPPGSCVLRETRQKSSQEAARVCVPPQPLCVPLWGGLCHHSRPSPAVVQGAFWRVAEHQA